MSPELIILTKKVDSFKAVLAQHGFEQLNFFWYSDGVYTSQWNNMTVACERPDREERSTMWQFGFKSQNKKYPRMHMEAIVPLAEDYFIFEIRHYPELKIHDKENYAGPTPHVTVSTILEEDLTNLESYVNYMLKLS
jgi:hypothetical protein